MQPIVSIIISNFNKGGFITETVNSVLNQTSVDWELIVIDDASSDESKVVLEKLESPPNVIFVFNTINKGANYCRNQAVSLAKGEYLIFLDADDLLATNCIANRLEYMRNNPSVDLAVFTMGVFKKVIGDQDSNWQPTSKNLKRDFLSHKLPWSILQPIWKRCAFDALGGFDPDFHRLQDVELHTRAVLYDQISIALVGGIPDCYYRIDESRKNTTQYIFLRNWIEACSQYCIKFNSKQNCKLLRGTWFESLVPIHYYRKQSIISNQEYNILYREHLKTYSILAPNLLTNMTLWVVNVINKFPFHVPGVGRFLKAAMITF